MKLKPLEDRVIIKAVTQEEKTVSGIVLPDTAKEKPQRGRIVAAGPGRLDDDGKRVPGLKMPRWIDSTSFCRICACRPSLLAESM